MQFVFNIVHSLILQIENSAVLTHIKNENDVHVKIQSIATCILSFKSIIDNIWREHSK